MPLAGIRPAWRSTVGDGEQFLEETADLARPVDEVDLQDPVAGIAVRVGLAQQLLIAGADREALGVSRCALVRESAR